MFFYLLFSYSVFYFIFIPSSATSVCISTHPNEYIFTHTHENKIKKIKKKLSRKQFYPFLIIQFIVHIVRNINVDLQTFMSCSFSYINSFCKLFENIDSYKWRWCRYWWIMHKKTSIAVLFLSFYVKNDVFNSYNAL